MARIARMGRERRAVRRRFLGGRRSVGANLLFPVAASVSEWIRRSPHDPIDLQEATKGTESGPAIDIREIRVIRGQSGSGSRGRRKRD